MIAFLLLSALVGERGLRDYCAAEQQALRCRLTQAWAPKRYDTPDTGVVRDNAAVQALYVQ
jgi:hypothetical protein